MAEKLIPSTPAKSEIEDLIAECIPGGSVCDPQAVADNIRRYCNAWPDPASAEARGDEPVAWREAVATAYGHLWHVNNEPAAPIPLYSPEKAAYEARKALRGLLTSEQRGEAINKVGRQLGVYSDDTRPAPAAPQAEETDELACAEEVLDGYAAHLPMTETAFDCIGDYITAVVSAVRAPAADWLAWVADDGYRTDAERAAATLLLPLVVTAPAAPQAAEADPLWPVDGLYADMTPPATSRDRWMFDQGRLAERRSASQPMSREGMSQAAQDVLAERRRQIEAEGWTPDHDEQHREGELCLAAAGYARATSDALQAIDKEFDSPGKPTLSDPVAWSSGLPWPVGWDFKPAPPRRQLVKAGALILAELERLDRASAPGVGSGEGVA